MRTYAAIAILFTCLFALVMASGALAMSAVAADEPAVAARQFREAMAAKDLKRASELTCRENQDMYANPGLLLAIDQELTGMRYETLGVAGDTARVRETGRIKAGVGGLSKTEDVDNVLVLKREAGRWKYC